MKSTPLLLLFIICCGTLFGQSTFNLNDKTFKVGSKRTIHIEYTMEHPQPIPGSLLVLDSIVTLMKTHPQIKIEIAAHTDPRGSAAHCNILSRARAQSCADYLISKGVDSARLVVKGYGFTQPLPGCSAADIAKMQTQQEKETAWQKDRRTEVVILEK